MDLNKPLRWERILIYAILLTHTLIALFPIWVILINSFKSFRKIFQAPLAFPWGSLFDPVGYTTVWKRSDFPLYLGNSLTVTLVSLFLILLLGAMAAWALSEYHFKGNTLLSLYFAFGIMIPIRLGTVAILRQAVAFNTVNTLAALIFVYSAQGLPITIFILQQFISQIHRDLKDAGRIDGANEYTIFAMILPLVRPAIATVAVFTMVPVWNDLWFPLILSPQVKTLILGTQQFMGQYLTDWNAVLASLTLTMVPAISLYVIFSKQLLSGITEGSVKS